MTNLYPSYVATKIAYLHQATLAMGVEAATKTASVSQCELPGGPCRPIFVDLAQRAQPFGNAEAGLPARQGSLQLLHDVNQTAILGHAQPEHNRERLDLKPESSRLGYEPCRDC